MLDCLNAVRHKTWTEKDIEVIFMATKSVLKNIEIKKPANARAFANALENAQRKRAETVRIKKAFSDASRDDIRKMFGVHHDGI